MAFELAERAKFDAKIAKLANIHKHLIPGVIDMDMITKHVYEQGPSGEAGRIAKEEGLELDQVTSLRLEYLRILKIDHIWVLPNLTKLQLNNNSIESIDNLHMLVQLRELDLSFNHIRRIENLEELTALEILHLDHNHLKVLENLENQRNLVIFSVGYNELDDCEKNILYLRQFEKLRSLCIAGNPMCITETFREYVLAFLSDLLYYENSRIDEKEKLDASGRFSRELALLQREEAKHRQEREAAEHEAAEIELHSVAFVERLNGDHLFRAMFENDPEGQVLVKLSEETKEFYQIFGEEITNVCKELFRVGQEQHLIRKREYDDFLTCVNEAKSKSQEASQRVLEDYLERRKLYFGQVRDVLNVLSEADETDEENRTEILPEVAAVIQKCTSEFEKLLQATWRTLMKYELTLSEQIEEVNTTLERDMSDMVGTMLESARGFFVEMRTLQESFNEQLTEASQRYLTMLDSDDSTGGSPKLREIMTDKESLNNSLSNSHENHLLVIDTREDVLVTRIQHWHSEVCENLQRKEVARNRERVLEISTFLDIQRDQYEELLESRPEDLVMHMDLRPEDIDDQERSIHEEGDKGHRETEQAVDQNMTKTGGKEENKEG